MEFPLSRDLSVNSLTWKTLLLKMIDLSGGTLTKDQVSFLINALYSNCIDFFNKGSSKACFIDEGLTTKCLWLVVRYALGLKIPDLA